MSLISNFVHRKAIAEARRLVRFAKGGGDTIDKDAAAKRRKIREAFKWQIVCEGGIKMYGNAAALVAYKKQNAERIQTLRDASVALVEAIILRQDSPAQEREAVLKAVQDEATRLESGASFNGAQT